MDRKQLRIAVAGGTLALAFLGGVAMAPAVAGSAAAQVIGDQVTQLLENKEGPKADLFQAAADYIGITTAQLRTQMGSDKSMADVAIAYGKDRNGLVQALTLATAADINALVDKKGTPQKGQDGQNDRRGPKGPALGFGIKVDGLEAATTYLGITAADLRTQLAAGKTLGQIADGLASAGKSKAGLIQAMVAAETTRIDAAVTAGKLTADQATKLKATVTEMVTKIVDSTRPAGAPGFFGPKGPRR
ncbi:MAG: hypothetical protein HYX56_00110 [Chloroflexi bacterium]|nr:hypothetical protein [Chloroflexota bacterium]